MTQLPIVHSQRPSYEWKERLAALRQQYEQALAVEPARWGRDTAWLAASAAVHNLRLRGLEISLQDVQSAQPPAQAALVLRGVERVQHAARAREPFNTRLLCEVHSLIEPQGGLLRDGAPVAAYRGHTPPPAEALPALLDNAAAWFEAPSFSNDFHPVEQAALVMLRICDLQPFPSANELSARLVASLFTLRDGWPLLVVHSALEQEYRSALVHALHMDTAPLVELLAQAVELTYRDLVTL